MFDAITKKMGEKAKVSIHGRFENNRNIDRMIELWEETAKVEI